eukprot:jgi/Botrbrau1/11487/Bobra.0360s0014.1
MLGGALILEWPVSHYPNTRVTADGYCLNWRTSGCYGEFADIFINQKAVVKKKGHCKILRYVPGRRYNRLFMLAVIRMAIPQCTCGYPFQLSQLQMLVRSCLDGFLGLSVVGHAKWF